MVGDRDPREHVFSVQLRAFDAAKGGAGLSLGVLLALCGALLQKSIKGGLVVGGGLNLGGSLDPIHNALELAELAIDKGATSLLMPITVRKQLFNLPDDMATKIDIQFYGDPKEAFVKVLTDCPGMERVAVTQPHSEKHELARNSLPEELRPVFDDLVTDYRFAATKRHGSPPCCTMAPSTSFGTALKRNAAPGVDGQTWQQYEAELEDRLPDLHRQVHSGTYRAQPSRRVYIPKSDGRQRPLSIASLEDKIVQQAVVTVLNAIYEEDFVGFSYGFRPGRSQHDALNALWAGIKHRLF
jgi:hypothetical protein